MTRAELERLLELADRAVELRELVGRAERLSGEIEDGRRLQQRVPELATAVGVRRSAITAIARELERDWVAQGPLIGAWQRAVELAEVAAAAGVDSAPYREEAVEAERQVEAARLASRDERDRLAAERAGLVDLLLELPFEVEPLTAVRDDPRPEAMRRDALEYCAIAERAQADAVEACDQSARRCEAATHELAGIGPVQELRQSLDDVVSKLPGALELPADAPPSAAHRLGRAGVAVHGQRVP
jgi:hypothetical protein